MTRVILAMLALGAVGAIAIGVVTSASSEASPILWFFVGGVLLGALIGVGISARRRRAKADERRSSRPAGA